MTKPYSVASGAEGIVPEEITLMNLASAKPLLRNFELGGVIVDWMGKPVRHYISSQDAEGRLHFSVGYDYDAEINIQIGKTENGYFEVLNIEKDQISEAVKYLMAVKDFYEHGAVDMVLDDRIGSELGSRVNRISGLQTFLEDTPEEDTHIIRLDRAELYGLTLSAGKRILNHYYYEKEGEEYQFIREFHEGHRKDRKYTVPKLKRSRLVEYLLSKIDNLEFSGGIKLVDSVGHEYRSNKTNPSPSQI